MYSPIQRPSYQGYLLWTDTSHAWLSLSSSPVWNLIPFPPNQAVYIKNWYRYFTLFNSRRGGSAWDTCGVDDLSSQRPEQEKKKNIHHLQLGVWCAYLLIQWSWGPWWLLSDSSIGATCWRKLGSQRAIPVVFFRGWTLAVGVVVYPVILSRAQNIYAIVKTAAVRVDHLIDVADIWRTPWHHLSPCFIYIWSVLSWLSLVLTPFPTFENTQRETSFAPIQRPRPPRNLVCIQPTQISLPGVVKQSATNQANLTPPRCRDFGWTVRLIGPNRKEEEEKEMYSTSLVSAILQVAILSVFVPLHTSPCQKPPIITRTIIS